MISKLSLLFVIFHEIIYTHFVGLQTFSTFHELAKHSQTTLILHHTFLHQANSHNASFNIKWAYCVFQSIITISYTHILLQSFRICVQQISMPLGRCKSFIIQFHTKGVHVRISIVDPRKSLEHRKKYIYKLVFTDGLGYS